MKNRKILIITLSIIILIILLLLCLNNYYGGFLFGKSSENKKTNRIDYTHIIYNGINDENNIKASVIYTINEKNVCISSRMKYEFSDAETAKSQYEQWKTTPDINNVQLENNIVCFNGTYNVGKTKQEIIDFHQNNSETIEIY